MVSWAFSITRSKLVAQQICMYLETAALNCQCFTGKRCHFSEKSNHVIKLPLTLSVINLPSTLSKIISNIQCKVTLDILICIYSIECKESLMQTTPLIFCCCWLLCFFLCKTWILCPTEMVYPPQAILLGMHQSCQRHTHLLLCIHMFFSVAK